MGLWLVQECRRTWAQQGDEMGYDQMTQLAREAPAFSVLIDPDDTVFLPAGDMPKRIVDYCQQTGQTPPSTPGAIVRCALESLAFKYRWTLEQIETVCNRQIDTVHIVGGGTQNRLLCQFTADATGRQVIAGPVEATAIGNIAVQAIAAKEIGSLTEARQIIKKTFQMQIYEPTETEQWDQVYQRFLEITGIREGVL
ncbi:MAG: FGGY-family carbohydrate kinase, partial [Candidatus Poribacteria bacterium]|nr:FGGY-family carbohydrate kinase [Candidatus Poribacteria bacterium]